MSNLFYDKLISLGDIEKKIKENIKDPAEREEIYHLIDEIIHHRVVGCVLDQLPQKHHNKFLNHLSDAPHDEGILEYLKEKIKVDVIGLIKHEVGLVANEIGGLIQSKMEEDPKPKPKKPKAKKQWTETSAA